MPRTTSLTCETIIVTDQLQTTQSIKQKISRQVNIEYILLTMIFILFPRYSNRKYRVLWLFQFFRIKVLKISLYSCLCKYSPTLSTIVGNPTPRDCNLNKNIFILHEDAFTQVSAILVQWVLRRRFFFKYQQFFDSFKLPLIERGCGPSYKNLNI